MIQPNKKLWLPSRPAIIVPERRRLPDARRRIIPVRSTVALDVAGSKGSSTTAGTSFNYTGLTISAGLTNSAATFVVVLGGTVTPTGPAATWNGVSCTLLGSQTITAFTCLVALFGLKSPSSGAQTLAVTWTNLADILAAGVSFSGVDQTTPFQNANGSQSGSTLSLGQAITTTSGNYTVGGLVAGSATAFTSSPGTNQSIFFDNTTLSALVGVDGAMSINPSTSASTTYTGTNSPTDFAAITGVDVKAAAGAAAVTPSSTPRLLMGVGV
jgi:hypothetical protein